MMELASNMIRFDEESRRYHEKKKAEGKKPLDAMRRVARQIVKIIYRLLDEERKYVPYSEMKEEPKAA
jgi:methanogenic corrinoid protein MtbC1